MDFATTKREVMKGLREWVRGYAIARNRLRPKKMRWERWQRHPTKTYRRATEEWRMWGVQAARGTRKPWHGSEPEKPLPLERICHAAYRSGYEDEKRRLELVARRQRDWARVGTLQEHLLGTTKCRIDSLA